MRSSHIECVCTSFSRIEGINGTLIFVRPVVVHITIVPTSSFSRDDCTTASAEGRLNSSDLQLRSFLNRHNNSVRLGRATVEVSNHFVRTSCTNSNAIVDRISHRSVIHEPLICSGLCRNNISIQGRDTTVANDRVTANNNRSRRITNDHNTSVSRHCRHTTRSRQCHNCRIVIGGHILIVGINIFTEDRASNTFDQIAISVPCEDCAIDIVSINNSSESNLSTVTNINSVINEVDKNVGHNRDRMDVDSDSISSPAVRRSLTNHNTESGGFGQIRSVGSGSSTRDVVIHRGVNRVIHKSAVFSKINSNHIHFLTNGVPLINEVSSIVIIQISCQGNLTVLTDLGLGSRNIDNRLRIYIDKILSRMRDTTSTHIVTPYINSVSVRLGTSIHVLSVEIVVAKVVTHVVSDLTRFIPCVVETADIHANSVNIGNQEH